MTHYFRSFEESAERVISHFGIGNIQLRLVGTNYGFSYRDLDRLIKAALVEWSFETPRCQRFRNWDPNVRLEELKKLEEFGV